MSYRQIFRQVSAKKVKIAMSIAVFCGLNLVSNSAFSLTALQDLCLKSGEGDLSISSVLPNVDPGIGSLNLLFNRASTADKLSAFSIASEWSPALEFSFISKFNFQELILAASNDSKIKDALQAGDYGAMLTMLPQLRLNVKSELMKAAQNQSSYTTEEIDGIKDQLKKSKLGFQQTTVKLGKKYGSQACYFTFPLTAPNRDRQILKCMAAADWLLQRMDVTEVNAEQVSLLDVVQSVLTEPVYKQGISRLALKIWSKVDLMKSNPSAFELQSSDFGDLYEDAVQSFIDVDPASDRQTSEERALNVLALYGTRGTSFSFMMGGDDDRLLNKDNAPVFMGLEIVSSGLSVLSRASLFSGKVYAYPASVRTSCQTNRPYHFWMSFYLARAAMKTRQFSNESIFAAIHSLEIAYKLGGPTSVPMLMSNPKYALSSALEVQKDLTLGEIGTWSALTFDRPIPIDADRFFGGLLSVGKPARPMETLVDRLPFIQRTSLQLVGGQIGLTKEVLDNWNNLVRPNENFEKIKPNLNSPN